MKTVDLVVAVVLPVLAAVATVGLRASLLLSVFLFFGLPAFYVTLRNFGLFKKSFSFAVLVSVPLSAFVDVLAAINGAWFIPTTLFPFRFFGVATVEVYLFSLGWVLYSVLFYEHFFDAGQSGDRFPKRIRHFVFLAVGTVTYVIFGEVFDARLLHIPYFYAVVGVLFVLLPTLIFLTSKPSFWRRFAIVGGYFFGLLALFEVAAVWTGQWVFPGQEFLAVFPAFGQMVPVEEVVIWMCFATVALLCYYETFADDLALHVPKGRED